MGTGHTQSEYWGTPYEGGEWEEEVSAWEYDDWYPEETKERELSIPIETFDITASGVRPYEVGLPSPIEVPPEPGWFEPVSGEVLVEEGADAGFLQNMFGWAKLQANISKELRHPDTSEFATTPKDMLAELKNTVWGKPPGEERKESFLGVTMRKGLGFFESGARALERLWAWQTRMGWLGDGGEYTIVDYLHLAGGKLAAFEKKSWLEGGGSEEAYLLAVEKEKEWNIAVKEMEMKGIHREIATDVVAVKMFLKEAKARGERAAGRREEHPLFPTHTFEPLPGIGKGSLLHGLSEEAQKEWLETEGLGECFYSISAHPELEKEYFRLREAGASPKEAGLQCVDPVVENWYRFVADPFHVVPLDTYAVSAVWKPVKWVAGKTLLPVAARIPVLRGAVRWGTKVTVQTTARRAARHTDDALKVVRAYAEEVGEDLTPQFIRHMLQTSPELLEELPTYYVRALAETAPYIDEIVDAVTPYVKEGLAREAIIGTVIHRLQREGLTALDETGGLTDLALRALESEVWESAIKAASKTAFIEAQTRAIKQLPSAQRKLMKLSNPLRVISQTIRGTLYDSWLGLRPAWCVFNYADNMVKLLIDGVNPFSSIPKLANRYTEYLPGGSRVATEISSHLDELHSIPFWRMGERGKRYTQLLAMMTPNQVQSSFGKSLMDKDISKSLIRKIPVLGGGFKKAIDWNTSLGGRIESAMRTRCYYHHFFKTMDEGYEAILKRKVVEEIGGTAVDLSDDVAEALGKKLRRLKLAPTAENARQTVLNMAMKEDSVILSTLGTDISETFSHIPDDVVTSAANQLDDLAELSALGSRAVTRTEIDEVFTIARKKIIDSQQEILESGWRAFDDMLPPMPTDADNLYKILVPSEGGASLEELWQAIDDMPLVAKRATLESQKISNLHWAHTSDLVEKGQIAEIHDLMDEFLLEVRPKFWNKFTGEQRECLYRIIDQIDEIADTPFPRELAEKYLKAGQALTDMQTAKMKHLQPVMKVVWDDKIRGQEMFDLLTLTRKQTDTMWDKVFPKAMADIHDSMVSIRSWMVKHGLGTETNPDLVNLAKGVNWTRVGQQIDDIPAGARKQVQPMLEELNKWRKHVFSQRSTPFKEVPLSSIDTEILTKYGDNLAGDVTNLISDAMKEGIAKTQDTLFDYETTENWMAALGNVIPFVRFPAKNLPYWIEKFAEVPHLVGAVHQIRNVQAAINKDLPARYRYTVAIPQFLTRGVMAKLGWNNCELRVNPWSFISAFSAMPGATAWSRNRISELHRDDGDTLAEDSLIKYNVLSEELGFGMFPFLEFAVGSMGLFGDKWYPDTFIGSWVPVVNWGLQEVFGFDKNYDIDKEMIKNLPLWWNSLFGEIIPWEQMNPDLFEDWAAGKEIRGLIMELPSEAAMAAATMSPTEARQIVRELDKSVYSQIRDVIVPIFEIEDDNLQGETVAHLEKEGLAVFMIELEKIGMRRSVRKNAFSMILGHSTALYAEPVDMGAEQAARKLQMERRQRRESQDPGQDRRDDMRQWYAEHPKYGLITTYGYREHPWAETAAGKEAELWSGVVSDYESQHHEFSKNSYEEQEKAVKESYQEHPGDGLRLKRIKSAGWTERQEHDKFLNKGLIGEIEFRMKQYIEANPKDILGIKRLREGWEVDMYVGVHLNSEEREKLRDFRQAFPTNQEGYEKLFVRLYDQARERQGPVQKKHVPGLNEGVKMQVEFSPLDNPNYTKEEQHDFLVRDLLQELWNKAPDRDEFEDSGEWWIAYNTYLLNLPENALETTQGQKQIAFLVSSQKMTETEAREVVGGWYTFDELAEGWKANDTPTEALEYVYKWCYISEADDEWFDRILPMKEADVEEVLITTKESVVPYQEFFLSNATSQVPWYWLAAQAKAESNFDPSVVGKAGERGLTQFMVATWDEVMGEDKDPYDPENSIIAQGKYMNTIYEQIKDIKPENTLMWAAIGYNWGPKHITKDLKLEDIPETTKAYLKKISKSSKEIKQAYTEAGEITTTEFSGHERYAMEREALRFKYGPIDAVELIPYIMKEYPGRWTRAALQKEIGGLTLPGYFDRLRMRKTGDAAVDANIWGVYNKLSAENQNEVRTAFGPLFQDHFLVGDTESITIEQRGAWLTALSDMVGKPMNWKTLPGVDLEIQDSGGKATVDFGLANVNPADMKEFDEAQKMNTEMWRLRKVGDEGWKELKDDPLRKKYFEGNAKSSFWNYYYEKIPPGNFSGEFRKNPMMAILLKPEVRHVAATNSDYDRALELMQNWVILNNNAMYKAGLDESEFEQVRKLTTAYYAIPEEDKETRKAFLKANPLLKKYWEAGKKDSDSYWRGGGRGGWGAGGKGGKRVDSRSLWESFRKQVGSSLPTVLQLLAIYWRGGELPPKTEVYLKKLHDKLGVGVDFETWLKALLSGWQSLGTSRGGGGVSVSSVPKQITPYYSHSTRGIRRR